MKKFKRISSAAVAAATAALMVVGTGFSAMAATVYDKDGQVVGDGGFYSYWDSDGNGTKEWAKAPYGMYDANIAGAIDNGDGTVTLTLKEGTFEITDGEGNVIRTFTGTITGIYVVDDEDHEDNLVSGNSVTINIGQEYTYAANDHHSSSTLKFVL